MKFSLDGGSTFFITTDPININDISIAPSGDGLICQSENELPAGAGGRHWYINPFMASIRAQDQIFIDEVFRGWVSDRLSLPNDIQQVILRRHSATGSVEGVFTCQIGNDINARRFFYILYPSELLLTYYNNNI